MTTNSHTFKGQEIIKSYLPRINTTPGVYRMCASDGSVLYVGKAKNIKKRVAQYAQGRFHTKRIAKMVALTTSMEFIYTRTEIEALLLESNLIKKYLPPFNVLLRDDKSFSYIKITKDHQYPQILKHRGAKDEQAAYFGPFPSGSAVSDTISALQKAFLLRNCSNSVFEGRKRPCLQYFIHRCSAPCVGKVTQHQYHKQVQQVEDFLKGKSQKIKSELKDEMTLFSQTYEFEKAAKVRDRIKALSIIQAHQNINIEGLKDVDVVALIQDHGKSCIQILFFRAGHHFGNKSYFPIHDKSEEPAQIMESFLGQFYINHMPPEQILVNIIPNEIGLVQDALSQRAMHRIKIQQPRLGVKQKVMQSAIDNATHALNRKLNEEISHKKLLGLVQKAFGLPKLPERIEIYDNSHLQGTFPVGIMVVFTNEGFAKEYYRKFNIKNPHLMPGDDYGMMREVLTRRFSNRELDAPLPDLVILDGGKGQLKIGQEVLSYLELDKKVNLIAIAKGKERDAGREKFFQGNPIEQIDVPFDSSLIYFMQRLRDEAHRFAIGSFRQRHKASVTRSALDDVPAIGPRRKKLLLQFFGSVKNIQDATLEELVRVEGISQQIAKKVYDYFH